MLFCSSHPDQQFNRRLLRRTHDLLPELNYCNCVNLALAWTFLQACVFHDLRNLS